MNAETTIAFDHMFDELSALSKVIDVYDGAIVWSKNHPEKLVINANLGSRIGGKENYLNSNQIESIHSGKSLEENIFTFIQNPEPDNAVIEFSIAINNRPLIWFRGRLIIHNEHSVLILLSEITELIESQKALESALVLSDEQNKRLKSFTHIISHNLRSHSSNIELLLETMKLTNPDILKAEEMVYLAKVSTKLSETINHLNEVVHMNSSLSWAMKPLNVFE